MTIPFNESSFTATKEWQFAVSKFSENDQFYNNFMRIMVKLPVENKKIVFVSLFVFRLITSFCIQ